MKNQVWAFFGGAIVGAAIALLLAPKSGEELRKDIGDYLDKEAGRGKKLINHGRRKVSGMKERVVESIGDTIGSAADQVDTMGKRASAALRKAERGVKRA